MLFILLVSVATAYLFAPLAPFVLDFVNSKSAYESGQSFNEIFESITTESHIAIHDPDVALQQYNREALTSQHNVILEEYNAFRSQFQVASFGELDLNQARFGAWKTLWLQLYGQESCILQKYFPKTLAAVQASGLPYTSIMISQLEPNQDISPHQGPTRAVLRYLMGLSIPTMTTTTTEEKAEEKKEASSSQQKDKHLFPHLSVLPCNVETGESCTPVVLPWTHAGQEIYFDDRFFHAAKNTSPDQERVILWLDLKRHDLKKGWRDQILGNLVYWLAENVLTMSEVTRTIQETDRRFCPADDDLQACSSSS